MSTPDSTCKATVDGLGKKGDRFTFLISLDRKLDISPGSSIVVADMPVIVVNAEDNYLSFELSFNEVVDTALAEVEIGSEVVVTKPGEKSAQHD